MLALTRTLVVHSEDEYFKDLYFATIRDQITTSATREFKFHLGTIDCSDAVEYCADDCCDACDEDKADNDDDCSDEDIVLLSFLVEYQKVL